MYKRWPRLHGWQHWLQCCSIISPQHEKTTVFALRVIILVLQDVGSSEGFLTMRSAKCNRQLLCVWPASWSHRQKQIGHRYLFLIIFNGICESMNYSRENSVRRHLQKFPPKCRQPLTGLCRAVFNCSLAEGGTLNGQTDCFIIHDILGESIVPHVGSNQVTMVLQKFILWNWFSDLFS